MADGDRRHFKLMGSVKPAGAGATDFSPSVEFTMLAHESVRCWGFVMIQKSATLQDYLEATGRFHFAAHRGTGTPAVTAFNTYEADGSLGTEFTITTDANGLVKVQFTKQDYRGSIFLEGIGVVQAET